VEARKVLAHIKGIRIVTFSEKDVIRHRLVQQIVKAYEDYEGRLKEDKGKAEA